MEAAAEITESRNPNKPLCVFSQEFCHSHQGLTTVRAVGVACSCQQVSSCSQWMEQNQCAPEVFGGQDLPGSQTPTPPQCGDQDRDLPPLTRHKVEAKGHGNEGVLEL